MTVLQLISTLEKAGIKLRVEQGELKYRAPKGAMNYSLRVKLSEQKAELVRFLQNASLGRRYVQEIIPVVSRQQPLRLSYSQQQIWLAEQVAGRINSTFHIPMALTIHGILNVEALGDAFDWLMVRHESLRTVFYFDGEEPYQRTLSNMVAPIVEHDLTQAFFNERNSAVASIVEETVQRPFNLDSGPLIRAQIIRLEECTHHLVLVMHHIISDAVSMDVLVEELLTAYESYRIGDAPLREPLSIQYADYAQWQRNRLESDVVAKQQDYWKQQLEHCPEQLKIPVDRARPLVKTNRGGNVEISLDSPLLEGLLRLAQQKDVTLYMLLLTAFNVVLGRWANQQDIAVGMPVAGRGSPQLESIVGCFVNTLVIRAQANNEHTLETFLMHVKEQVLDAQANPDIPIEWIVKALGIPRNPSFSPLCQVALSLVMESVSKQERYSGLDVEPMEIELMGARQDITLMLVYSAVPGKPRLSGMFEYNADLFDTSSIQSVSRCFIRVLEQMVSDIQQSLMSQDRQPLVISGPDVLDSQHSESRGSETILSHIAAQIEETPNAIAIVFGESCMTYRALGRKSDQIARWLIGQRVQQGDYIAISVEPCAELVPLILGVLRCGAVYVPIDIHCPNERIEGILEDCLPKVLLTDLATRPSLLASSTACLIVDYREAIAKAKESRSVQCFPKIQSHNPIYVIYTSGSTGQPKGVEISHASESNLLHWYQQLLELSASDRFLLVSSVGFDLTQKNIFAPLMSGARLVLMDLQPYDPIRIADAINAHQITVWNSSPSAFYPLSALTHHTAYPFPSLRHVVLGGESIRAKLIIDWLNESKTLAVLTNSYGPTECTDVVAYWQTQGPLLVDQPLPIGVPIPNVQLYVLDEFGEHTGTEQVGELYISGECVGNGYIRQVADNGGFSFNPFGNGNCYRTGDSVRYRTDGLLEYVGRVDKQVKVNGFRIELSEVEACLVSMPSIVSALVVSTDSTRLVAYVLSKEELNTESVKCYVEQRLPHYMVPSVFVLMDSFPLTINGKIDFAALPKAIIDDDSDCYIAPSTETEKCLVSIWEALLPVKRIGIQDSFFALGGDSILAIQMVSRARGMNITFSVIQVFECQTIKRLTHVAEMSSIPFIAEQGLLSGDVPLHPAQQRFFDIELTHLHHFNQSLMLTLPSTVREWQLKDAWREVLRQHDALRIHYREDGEGCWTQRFLDTSIDDFLNVIYQEVEIDSYPKDAQQKEIERNAAETQTTLDLINGPLIRIRRLSLAGESTARMLVVIHHLVIDGVSWRILVEDIQRALRQSLNGEKIELGKKTSSVRQWIDALGRYAKSERSLSSRAYWERLAAVEVVKLPLVSGGDITRRHRQCHVATIERSLLASDTEVLISNRVTCYNTTVTELLLVALSMALSARAPRRAKVKNIVVDLEGHGRENIDETVDVSRTVGWFTSIFPLLLAYDGQLAIGDRIKTVKEQYRSIPHKGLSYGMLRYLANDKCLRSMLEKIPKSDVCFNYLGQLDHGVGQDELLELATESVGEELSPDGERYHQIEITAKVLGGRLHIHWRYNPLHIDELSMTSLADEFMQAILQVNNHCLNAQNVGYTPSDFPLASLTQSQLDSLLPASGLEAVYPLSPVQEGMLFHYLQSPESRFYYEQISVNTNGDLKEDMLRASWETLVSRQPMLRTAFLWDGLDRPLQAVYNKVFPLIESMDWSLMPKEDIDKRLQSFLEDDRKCRIDLSEPYGYRFTVIRLPQLQYQWVFSFHHILLDGWSLPIVFQEFFDIYDSLSRNDKYTLASPPPYQMYISWLQQNDVEKQQAYWENYLRGLLVPTDFPTKKTKDNRSGDYRDIAQSVGDEVGVRLRQLARDFNVTLSLLLQGAWGIVLSEYSAEETVLFGTTVSGRPDILPDAEKMVGMFISTLPTRMDLKADSPFIQWLVPYQQINLEQKQYETSALVDIHQWSEIPNTQPLFNTLFVHENFPVGDRLTAAETLMGIQSVVTHQETHFPLTAVFYGVESLSVKLSYDADCCDSTEMNSMLDHIVLVLSRIASAPNTPLKLLAPEIAEMRRRRVECNVSIEEVASPVEVIQDFTLPRNKLEKQLLVIWQNVLLMKKISVYDNFFELGGHSLLVGNVQTRIKRKLNIALPMRMFFEVATIAELADVISALQSCDDEANELKGEDITVLED